jgi:hypothetical protein
MKFNTGYQQVQKWEFKIKKPVRRRRHLYFKVVLKDYSISMVDRGQRHT